MKLLILPILAMFLLIGCGHDFAFKVSPEYEINDAQVYLLEDGGDSSVAAGIMAGPGFHLYMDGYSVMGIGSLGFAGMSSLQDAPRFTGAPLFAPITLFNGAISPVFSYRFAGEDELLYGVTVSVGKIFKPRKKIEE